jgi:hypothetical protein
MKQKSDTGNNYSMRGNLKYDFNTNGKSLFLQDDELYV